MNEEYEGLTLPDIQITAPKLYSQGYDDEGNPIYTTDYSKSDKGITERLIKEGKYYTPEEIQRDNTRKEIARRRPGELSLWVKPIRDFAVGSIGGALGVTALGTMPGKFNPIDAGKYAWTEILEGKPLLAKMGKDVLAGMFGADVFNATNRAVTGQSFDDWIVNNTPIKHLPINQDYKYMIGSTFNPGGWLSFGAMNRYGNQISNAANNGMSFIADKLKPITRSINRKINKINKNFTAEKRINNLQSKIAQNISDLNRQKSELFNNWTKENNYWTHQQDILDPEYRYPHPKLRFSLIDYSKYRTQPNRPFDLPEFLETVHKPYDVQTGEVILPRFGTDQVNTFEIKPYSSKKEPITNYSTRNKTNIPKFEEFGNLDQEYIEALRHNIEYVKSKYPGSVAFGSSIGVTEGGLPHATHDIDLYITDADLKALGKEDLPWVVEGLTKRDQLDGGRYGKYGDIDLNIIFTKEDGTIDFTKGRGLDLFRQLYPEQYQKAYLEANGDLSSMRTDVTTKALLQKINEKPILNTIMDAFESSKPKHTSRALWYLNHADPDLVYESLLKHGESLMGKNMKHAPVTEQDFLDYNKNLELLEEMGLPGLLSPEDAAKDPKRMRDIFEYWWQNNTIVSRGTSIENMPYSKAVELGVPHERDFGKYAVRNLTEWSGGTGHNLSGTGLNTVQWGDSGGGVAGNDIYGQLQLQLSGLSEGLSPEELIKVVRRNFPRYDDYLNTPVKVKDKFGKEHDINQYNDLLQLQSNITPEELSRVTESLGVRGIVGGPYAESIYVGITQKPKPEDIYYINPAFRRHSGYAHPTSAYSRHLRPSYNNWDQGLFDKMSSLENRYKHFDAYEANSPEYFSKYKGILGDKARKWITKKRNDSYEQYSKKATSLNRVRKSIESRNNKLYDMLWNAQRQKRKVQDFTNATLGIGTGLGALGGIGYGIHYLTELPSKREVENYLDNYEITPEQLKSLESASDFGEKARLLKAWKKLGNLKLKSK